MAVEHDESATDQGGKVTTALMLEIRRLRESHGLTQQEMAKRLGLSARSAVAHYESGRRKPPADILAAYASAFQLAPETLLSLRDSGLAEQAQQRYVSALAELAAVEKPGSGSPAATAPPVTADTRGERVRARWRLAGPAALFLICTTLTGSAAAANTSALHLDPSWTQSTQNVTDHVEPSSSPEPMDGDDPRARDCYPDAVTELTAPMYLPGGAPFGTLRLRHSAHCDASWGSAYYANPNLYTIRIIVHRPADGAEIVFDWSNNTPPGSYSDMLSTGLGCVWVEAVVITSRGTSVPARTGCST